MKDHEAAGHALNMVDELPRCLKHKLMGLRTHISNVQEEPVFRTSQIRLSSREVTVPDLIAILG